MNMNTGLSTITCPQCARSLTPDALKCQFCGNPLLNIVRPKGTVQQIVGPQTGLINLYYGIAVYWIVEGLVTLIQRALSLSNPKVFTGGAYTGLLVGGFSVLLGIGLIMRWDWARDAAKYFAAVRLILGVLAIMAIAGVTSIFGGGAVALILTTTILGVIAAVLQLYILPKTEDII
jgi:hypothetical protein